LTDDALPFVHAKKKFPFKKRELFFEIMSSRSGLLGETG
jgi:hypothetical protein